MSCHSTSEEDQDEEEEDEDEEAAAILDTDLLIDPSRVSSVKFPYYVPPGVKDDMVCILYGVYVYFQGDIEQGKYAQGIVQTLQNSALRK